MAIALSGGPIINQTFVGATKQNIIDGIETQLLAAGWSTVSGHGTTNLLMQTGTTPGTGQGLNGRFRFKDNAANCVTISCESTNGSRVHPNDTTNGIHLLPGTAKAFRVIANPYQFFVFTGNPNVSREFACGGVLYLPPNIQGAVWEAIWLSGNSYTDAGGSLFASLRTGLYASCTNYQAICNGIMMGWANNTTNSWTYSGQLNLMVPACALTGFSQGLTATGAYRFHNDDVLLGDPLLAWGLNSAWEEGKIRGQLWDALIMTKEAYVDFVYSIGGRNMFNITSQNVGASAVARGSLLVVVP